MLLSDAPNKLVKRKVIETIQCPDGKAIAANGKHYYPTTATKLHSPRHQNLKTSDRREKCSEESVWQALRVLNSLSSDMLTEILID